MDLFYPQLDLAVLQNVDLVRRLSIENPDYFQAVKCPYSPEIKAWFKQQVTAAAAVAYAELASPEVEAEELLKHLKSLKSSLGTETADQLAWVRAAATLLDKIVSVKERSAGLARAAAFERIVTDMLADIMSPEQRTLFIDKLAAAGLS